MHIFSGILSVHWVFAHLCHLHVGMKILIRFVLACSWGKKNWKCPSLCETARLAEFYLPFRMKNVYLILCTCIAMWSTSTNHCLVDCVNMTSYLHILKFGAFCCKRTSKIISRKAYLLSVTRNSFTDHVYYVCKLRKKRCHKKPRFAIYFPLLELKLWKRLKKCPQCRPLKPW